eukprot:5212678-Prymnesium_polylepis.1
MRRRPLCVWVCVWTAETKEPCPRVPPASRRDVGEIECGAGGTAPATEYAVEPYNSVCTEGQNQRRARRRAPTHSRPCRSTRGVEDRRHCPLHRRRPRRRPLARAAAR